MKIIEFFKQHNLSLNQQKIIIATSAGPDSMALVDMLRKLQVVYDLKLIIAHFDHQLRKDSYQEYDLLKEYCQKNNLILENKIWAKADQPQVGLEAAARKYRYDFLSQIVKKYHGNYLLTAHHGDDLLENILIKFIRSGNPEEMNSLQAFGKMNGVVIVRPLLAFSKQELLKYDYENNLAFIEDATNKQDDTIRNRMRHHIVPLLKKENPNLLANSLRFTKELNLLSTLAQTEIANLNQPTKFLRYFFRLKEDNLVLLNQIEQQYYWRKFIWQKYHLRVNNKLSGFNLIKYQGYFYLWSNHLKIQLNFVKKIKIEQKFNFYDQQFIISVKNLNLPIIGDFWSNEDSFYAGNLVNKKLLLKNGQHVKAKKMFAQAAIPEKLRPFCLSIYNSQKIAVFVERVYQDQRFHQNGQHYFVYQLKKR